MNRVLTNIWENVYEYIANKYLRVWLWIQCQQIYESMVMNRVPTNIWENVYEYSANKCLREELWI